MRLSNSFQLCPGKRRLIDVCRALKIEIGENHSAGNDAKMCASILRCLAEQADLATMSDPVSCRKLWKRQATPLGITRQKARSKPIQSPLQILLERLPQLSTADLPAIDEYLLVLDRILEDRIIEEDEVDEIASVAAELGLTADDITEIHDRYISNLIGLVLSDGIVTEDERRDLSRVAGLLGIEQSRVEELLAERPSGDFGQTEELSGKTVCFTGELRCKIDGDDIGKSQAEAIAEKYGLTPKPSVTKNLDILVVADPNTQSGKAKKARQYGIRIMAERAFWHKLGIAAE